MAKTEKTRDLTDLLMRRIRNFHISEGVALEELKAVKEIVEEYFKVLFDLIISGHTIKIGGSGTDLVIKTSLINIEDVDKKKNNSILVPRRIDKAIIVEFNGMFLRQKNTKMYLTKKARLTMFKKVNYKNIESI